MNFNKENIEKLRNGKAVIMASVKDDLELLNKILRHAFPEDSIMDDLGTLFSATEISKFGVWGSGKKWNTDDDVTARDYVELKISDFIEDDTKSWTESLTWIKVNDIPDPVIQVGRFEARGKDYVSLRKTAGSDLVETVLVKSIKEVKVLELTKDQIKERLGVDYLRIVE